MSKMRKEYDPNKVKRRKRKPIVYALIPPRRNFEICYEHCNQFVGNDACIVLQTGCTQHSTHHTANNLSHRP